MPSTSIIVPFFNSSNTIKDTLISISNQTYKNFECILIDDASTDSSFSIASDFISTDNRFRLYKKEKNTGVVDSRNLGINYSSCRYLTFLDSDDLWHPEFLEESHKIRNNSTEYIPITHTSYYRFTLTYEKIITYLVQPPSIVDNRNILEKNHMPLLTVLLDRKYIKKILFKNTRPEDYKLWIELLYIRNLKSICINKPLAYYRVSKTQRSSKKYKSIIRIYKLFGCIKSHNRLSQVMHTLSWIFHNTIQRLFYMKKIDNYSNQYLQKILFNRRK